MCRVNSFFFVRGKDARDVGVLYKEGVPVA